MSIKIKFQKLKPKLKGFFIGIKEVLQNFVQTKKKAYKLLSFILLVVNLLMVGLLFQTGYQNDSQQVKAPKPTVLGRVSAPIFDPNLIMSDEDFSTNRAFGSVESVQRVLDRFDSPLRNFKEDGKTAAQIIYDAARGVSSRKWNVTPRINPGVILAYLEKEMSLLSIDNYDPIADPSNRVKRAMGYGCPDTGRCDQQYFGFTNQLNWAAYQLQFNFNIATGSGNSAYKVNTTITTLDEYDVFLTNAATAANYRYTPHVYWGNYNLWKIMTAHGWGVSSDTFSYANIDAANLSNKDRVVRQNTGSKIRLDEVRTAIMTDYSLGQKSNAIERMQQFLRQEGFLTTRDATGLYGTITRTAQMAYRRENGLIGNFTNVSESECRKLFAKKWQIGEQSEEVKQLQRCLRDVGYFDWPLITGLFGQVTQEGLQDVIIALDKRDKGGNAGKDTIETQSGGSNTIKANISTSCQSLANTRWQFGQRSNQITELQKCMQTNGFYDWPAGYTGLFGAYTSAQFEKWKTYLQADNRTSTASTGTSSNLNSTSNECNAFKNQKFTKNQRSEEIKKMQECMKNDGFYDWPAGYTGLFGAYTSVQFEKWIQANPFVEANSKSSNQNTSSQCQKLKTEKWTFGENSQRVRELQQCMQTAGTFNWPGGATGYFGNATQQALNNWLAQK